VYWLLMIGAVIGLVSAIGGKDMFPAWYLIAIVLCSVVATWLGGRLAVRRWVNTGMR
jgi:uncharacterized membrane protein YhaH (DUF805 family)